MDLGGWFFDGRVDHVVTTLSVRHKVVLMPQRHSFVTSGLLMIDDTFRDVWPKVLFITFLDQKPDCSQL